MHMFYCKLSPKEIIMDIDRYIDALKQGKFPNGSCGKVKLRKSLASEHNISLLFKFFAAKKVSGKWKSEQTVRNYIFNLHGLAEYLCDKNFEDAGKDEITGYIDFLTRKNGRRTKRKLANLTIDIAKSRLMSFYRWLNNNKLPDFLVEMDLKVDLKPISVKAEQLLSEEDINKMIKLAANTRDKAIIAFLYESGCRIGEMLSLRLKNIRFDDYGALISVSGKTGSRDIRIVNCVPYLKEWIRYHPASNEENWLWVSKYEKEVEKLNYMSISHMLKDLGKKAEIKKSIRPHLFRHSIITRDSEFLSESALRLRHGWSSRSDMPERYIHLSGKKLDDMTLKNLYRINTEGKKEKREIAMSPKICPNCGESNPSDYDFCLKCKWALDNNSISRPEKEYWKTVTLEKLEKLVDEKLEEIVIRRMSNS